MSKTETKPSTSQMLLNPKPQFTQEDPQKHPEQPSVTATAIAYSGPVPLPGILVEYEKLYPGIAKQFLEEPHKEAEHRRSLEKKVADAQIKLANRGQIFAFILSSAFTVGGIYLASQGHNFAGFGTLATLIITLGIVFGVVKRR